MFLREESEVEVMPVSPVGATRRTNFLDEDEFENILAGGPSGRDARLLRAVFAQSGVGVGISDIAGNILVVNTAFAAMFGYDVEEFAATLKITDLTHPDDTPEVWELYTKLIRGEVDRVRIEKPHLHRDGHTIWNSVNVSLIRCANGAPVYTLALFEDVTHRHELEERMRYQALHDPLTGLPNRVLFSDQLRQAFADPQSRVGVCYVDLDKFKAVNDTLGHDVGDKLLVEVADRLRLCLQRPGQSVARIGGDEFVFLVAQSDGTGEVSRLAEAVMNVLASPICINGHPFTVSASVGVMEERVAATSPDILMKRADMMLARAKDACCNRWLAYDRDRDSTPIHAALNRGEFFLVYQPIIRLADNCIIGAEALLRWAHPTLGTLPPNRFIELAEGSGLSLPLTVFVIEQACRYVRDWRENSPGSTLFVSVNITTSNIYDPGFVTVVQRALAESGVSAKALQLELTEHAGICSDQTVVLRLRELSALGVGIAIDDFGCTLSNLTGLPKLPVSVIKLSGEFIQNLGNEIPGRTADEHIVHATIDLAHRLGLTVTAEQVENHVQATRLRELGCDAAQGWHFVAALAHDQQPLGTTVSTGSGPGVGDWARPGRG